MALTGDGGDELFAGYDPFSALALARIYKNVIPSRVHKGMRKLVELLPKSKEKISLTSKWEGTLGLAMKRLCGTGLARSPKINDIKDLFNEDVHGRLQRSFGALERKSR